MKSLGRLALTYACSPSLFLRFHDSYGSYEKFQPGFRDELKANDPGDEF